MLTLVEPTADLRAPWLEAYREWGPGLHEDGFGVSPSDDVFSEAGFAAWLARLHAEERGLDAGGSDYRCVYRWILEDGRVLGGIALRYGDDPFLLAAGHIGYGIRPSARRRGVATWALGAMIDIARELRLPRVLLVCDATNRASIATIERNGGALEDTDDDGPLRRYWIAV